MAYFNTNILHNLTIKPLLLAILHRDSKYDVLLTRVGFLFSKASRPNMGLAKSP